MLGRIGAALILNETISPMIPVSTTQILRLPDINNNDDDNLRVAFGSCYGLLNFSTDIFAHVNKYKPDVWIWLGDAAYTDDIMGACKLKS